jgi:hypothetical protein
MLIAVDSNESAAWLVVLQFGLAELLEHQLLLCRAGSFCCNNYH